MTLKTLATTAVALFALAALPAAAAECPKDTLGDEAVRLKEGALTIAYRTIPAQIEVGAPFSVEIVACAGAYAPTDIRVDAAMPMHGHGMNYQPGMRKIAPGHAAFDGLVFHMPGDWVLSLDLFDGDTRTRLTQKVTLRR